MRPNHRPAVSAAPGTSSATPERGGVRALGPVTRRRRLAGVAAVSSLSVLVLASGAQGATVGLGSADPFGVLAGSAVSNSGATLLTGDLGLAPGSSVTGFGPGSIVGATHVNDAVATLAKSDLVRAYDDAASRPSTAAVAGDLAGRTLTGGVYTAPTTLGLTGDLVLDGQGDPDAVFVLRAGTSLTVGSGSRVRLIGGAQSCNVFWQVGTSATIGTGSAFTGNVLALTSITLTAGVTVDGRLLARNGAVVLDSDVITRSTCAAAPGGGTGTTPGGGGTGTSPGGGTPGTGTSPGTGSTGGTGTTPATGATPPGGGSGGSGGSGGTSGSGSGTGTTGTPLATTRPATSVGRGTAVVGGTVRSGGGTTTYSFDYGTTDDYGRRTPQARAPGGGSAKSVRRALRGLRSSSTYHYRVVVIGPGGHRVYGRDRTFRTRSRPVARLPRTSRGFAG